MIMAVTAFVPIPGHPRSEEEYPRLADAVDQLGVQMPLMSAEGELEHCWLYQYLQEFNVTIAIYSFGCRQSAQKNALRTTSFRRRRQSSWWQRRWLPICGRMSMVDRLRHFSHSWCDRSDYSRIS